VRALIEPLSNPLIVTQILVSSLESGGDDGARTRDLCRAKGARRLFS
jgi:hypothetical protein